MDADNSATLDSPRPRSAALEWDLESAPWPLRVKELSLFAALYTLLVTMGHVLRENPAQLTIMWPAAGLLLCALWLAPPRNWPWLLAVQFAIDIGAHRAYAPAHVAAGSALFALADTLAAVTGALILRHLVRHPDRPSIGSVVRFFLAAAAGAAVGAFAGAYGAARFVADADYALGWQLWWAGAWVGTLCTLPVTLMCAIGLRTPALQEEPISWTERLLWVAVLFGLIIWIFMARSGGFSSLLDMPVVVLAVLVAVAFRLPPRWAVGMAAAAALLIAAFSSAGLGPYAAAPELLARVGRVQIYLSALLSVNLMLAVALRQMRDNIRRLHLSEERYRNFIEHSSEAVWRVELEVAMPAGLSSFEQREWLQKHAYIAECNLQYRRLNDRATGRADPAPRAWRADVPWSAIYLEHLETSARRGFSMQGLRFEMEIDGKSRTFLTDFTGHNVEGKLQRIWGVARDVTELTELNASLRRKQERLHSYAVQLTGAEERARRAIAVDLHDGIGQQLAGLGMTLDAAHARAPADVRALIGEAATLLRDVQSATQKVIADLSPPGLYDLGLASALQWLCVQMRGKDDLQVELKTSVDDSKYDLDQRVLAYKIVRELLRNVVKHAGVKQARVVVTQSPGELRLEVSDAGVGFEWQLDLFESRDRGFGLWSVVDRVKDAKGEVTVDTAPGKGCRVRVLLPLAPAASAD